VPELPEELWQAIHAIARRNSAATVLQRAVRIAIQRSEGSPWDLPALLPGTPPSPRRPDYGHLNLLEDLPAMFFTLTVDQELT